MNKNSAIAGKKILFIAPNFFGYELKIKAKMEQLGASVAYYDVRSVSSAFDRSILKVFPNIFKKRTKTYYNEILKANKSVDYDYVFIIKCDMISIHILNEMKSIFKNAKFYLYLWDSIKNVPGITNKLSFFSKVLSFDRNDVKKHENIGFYPLFYIDELEKDKSYLAENKLKYDICFFGTIHSDRYRIIKEIKNYCAMNNYSFYTFLYLQSNFIYWFYKFTKREFASTKFKDFNYEKLSGNSISQIVKESGVVLDIEHPKQTGLTMRTFEVIGMEKKLITTNKDIVNYDFYNPNNILVIPRKGISIPKDFLAIEYEPLDVDIYQKYSIGNWIQGIFTE